MNELYKLLLNLQDIAKANNLFMQAFEARFKAIEDAIDRIERSLVINTIDTSEPTATGAETIGE